MNKSNSERAKGQEESGEKLPEEKVKREEEQEKPPQSYLSYPSVHNLKFRL